LRSPFSYIICVILLLSLSLSSLFYYAYLDIAQVAAKANTHFCFSGKHSLETVTISLKEFKNIKEDEIWLHGDLYDIVSYKISGDHVQLNLYHDSKEESIISQIADHFKTETDDVANDNYKHICSKHNQAPNQYKCLFHLPSVHIVSAAFAAINPRPIFHYIPYNFFSVLSPPPRSLFVF
jgi:hypothetical protein